MFRCDRVLWYGGGLRQLSYVRGESRFSDHRPVYSMFWAEVESYQGRLRKSMSYSSSRIQVEELLPYSQGYTELCFFWGTGELITATFEYVLSLWVSLCILALLNKFSWILCIFLCSPFWLFPCFCLWRTTVTLGDMSLASNCFVSIVGKLLGFSLNCKHYGITTIEWSIYTHAQKVLCGISTY